MTIPDKPIKMREVNRKLATFLDRGSCFSFTRRKGKPHQTGPRIVVFAKEEVCWLIQSFAGCGAVKARSRQDQHGRMHKDFYFYAFGLDAVAIARRAEPYLVRNRELAQLILNFAKDCMGVGRPRLNADQKALRSWYLDKYDELRCTLPQEYYTMQLPDGSLCTVPTERAAEQLDSVALGAKVMLADIYAQQAPAKQQPFSSEFMRRMEEARRRVVADVEAEGTSEPGSDGEPIS